VYLVLPLVMLRYVDERRFRLFGSGLPDSGAPSAAVLIPAAFFLSVVSPTSTHPNGLLNLETGTYTDPDLEPQSEHNP
jgi:hypothetical protein